MYVTILNSLATGRQPLSSRGDFLCNILSSVQTMVWLSVLGIFNTHTDVDACSCTLGLYKHQKFVLEADWKKNSLPHWEVELSTAAC